MKTQVPFETYPVNAALDPSRCYAMKLKDLQIVNDDSVFEEVVKEKTLPMSPELLEFGFRCVLSTMAERVSKDCRPRKVGNILKATPYLRGKLKSPYSAFDKSNCSCAIVFTSLSGLEKSVNTEKYIQFVNTKTGTRVTIDRIVYEGCVDSSQIATIMRGKGIAVTGLNCQWLEGDSCTLAWADAEGAEHTASIEPTSATVTEMHFAWPEALADVPADSKVEMRFLTRGGIADAEPQPNNKTVTLIAGEPVPEPLVTSQDGLVKVMSLGELTNKRTAALAGVNVGYDAATGRGIDEVVAYVGGKEVHWKSSKGAGFDAGEVTLTYEPGEDAPAPGEYTADVAVEYALGTGEGYDEMVIQNRTIVIGE